MFFFFLLGILNILHKDEQLWRQFQLLSYFISCLVCSCLLTFLRFEIFYCFLAVLSRTDGNTAYYDNTFNQKDSTGSIFFLSVFIHNTFFANGRVNLCFAKKQIHLFSRFQHAPSTTAQKLRSEERLHLPKLFRDMCFILLWVFYPAFPQSRKEGISTFNIMTYIDETSKHGGKIKEMSFCFLKECFKIS